MTTTTATPAVPFTYSVPKVKGPEGYEVVRKNTATGEKAVVMTYAKRDDARADAARSNRDEQAVTGATVTVDLATVEADVAMEAAMDLDCPQDEAFDAAVVAALESGMTADEMNLAADHEEATRMAAELAEQPQAEVAPVAEEAGASTDEVLEQVRLLGAVCTLPRTKLAAMVEAGEVDGLLDAMDAVRSVLASRTKVRLYASKLDAGQRISLRDAGTVTVTDRVKVEARKVLVSWVDEAGVKGERVMGSWQWITLA